MAKGSGGDGNSRKDTTQQTNATNKKTNSTNDESDDDNDSFIYQVNEYDVVLPRHGDAPQPASLTKNHPGQIVYRGVLWDLKDRYREASTRRKRNVVGLLVHHITHTVGGRFLVQVGGGDDPPVYQKAPLEEVLVRSGRRMHHYENDTEPPQDYSVYLKSKKHRIQLEEDDLRPPETSDNKKTDKAPTTTTSPTKDVVAEEEETLYDVSQLNGFDVLVGRGAGVAKYVGNAHFRCVVWGHKEQYQIREKDDKRPVGVLVADYIEGLGGRFLQCLGQSRYRTVYREDAIQKCLQSLREKKTREPPEYLAYWKARQKQEEKCSDNDSTDDDDNNNNDDDGKEEKSDEGQKEDPGDILKTTKALGSHWKILLALQAKIEPPSAEAQSSAAYVTATTISKRLTPPKEKASSQPVQLTLSLPKSVSSPPLLKKRGTPPPSPPPVPVPIHIPSRKRGVPRSVSSLPTREKTKSGMVREKMPLLRALGVTMATTKTKKKPQVPNSPSPRTSSTASAKKKAAVVVTPPTPRAPPPLVTRSGRRVTKSSKLQQLEEQKHQPHIVMVSSSSSLSQESLLSVNIGAAAAKQDGSATNHNKGQHANDNNSNDDESVGDSSFPLPPHKKRKVLSTSLDIAAFGEESQDQTPHGNLLISGSGAVVQQEETEFSDGNGSDSDSDDDDDDNDENDETRPQQQVGNGSFLF